MVALFTNNAYSTLAAGITDAATSITLATGEGARFPSPTGTDYFYATLIDTANNLEIVKCTARAGDVLTVTRAQESTTAQAYSTGDRIEVRLTAAGLTDVIDQASAALAAFANHFAFSTTVTMDEPGVGNMRFNHADPASATAIAIDDQSNDAGNPDISNYIISWDDSTNGTKGYLHIYSKNDPATFVIYGVTALVDNVGWSQLTVVHSASGGTFADGEEIMCQFTRAGDEGAPGGAATVQTFTNKTINDFSNYVHADGVHVKSRNTSGATVNRGDVVYITGYNAGEDCIEIALADADDAAKMPGYGVVDEDIANNANGSVLSKGVVTGDATYALDTSTWAVGDELYVDVTAGALTNVRPTGKTTAVQKIATVLRSHASLGSIFVNGAGRSNDFPNSGKLNAGVEGTSYSTGNTGAGTVTLDASNSNYQHGTATGSFTLGNPTFTGVGAIEWELTNDATGGYSPDFTTNTDKVVGSYDATALATNLIRLTETNGHTTLEFLNVDL